MFQAKPSSQVADKLSKTKQNLKKIFGSKKGKSGKSASKFNLFKKKSAAAADDDTDGM